MKKATVIGAGEREMPPLRKPAVPVHVWATGQDDNIGDSLLRRGYLSALQKLGPVIAWTGEGSGAYLSGLAPETRPEFHSSFLRWYVNAAADSIKGPTVIALNAGELTISGKGAGRFLRLIPLLCLTRVRKGAVLWLGASIPNHRNSVRWVYSLTAKICTMVRWREQSSCENSGYGSVMPDWAFGLGTHSEDWASLSTRDYLGIVLRGDRGIPDDYWFDWVLRTSADLRLRPHVIVQVKRDTAHSEYVAKRIGCSITAWQGDDSHSTQESVVRQMYGKCALVVGDRLHGLVVASTEGAVPLAWTPTAKDKVQRHFLAVGADWVGLKNPMATKDYPEIRQQDLLEYGRRNGEVVDLARKALREVVDDMIRAVSPAQAK